MSQIIKGLTPTLRWIMDLMSLFQVEAIRIPQDYRAQVLSVKEMLEDDPSGLTNTILDFAINCALVEYKVETNNKNLTETLNEWLKDINGDLRGKIPTGLKALAKEYFRERWKGSSNILLRTFWNQDNGLELPTSLFFVDGEDIKVDRKSKDGAVRLGDEIYYIRIGSMDETTQSVPTKADIRLPSAKNEMIFSQKPFENWGTAYPTPFLIKKGVYHNSEFLKLMLSKGEFIVAKALEYLFIMKKGTERMFFEGNVSYGPEDLKQASQDLKELVEKKKTEPGFPSYTTNFDTEIAEYIPDYKKAINDEIYAPAMQRILAGLGFVEVIEGTGSTRREAILNPKPFMAEVEQGISDFKALITDILKEIITRNEGSHKKWMGSDIRIVSSPVKHFMDDKYKTFIRGLYDRGLISKRTMNEYLEIDMDVEIERRKQETKAGLDKTMYPPIVQNLDEKGDGDEPKAGTTPDKQGPEKKNFTKSDKD